MPRLPSARSCLVLIGFVIASAAIAPGIADAKIPSQQHSTFPTAVLGSASGTAGECRVVLHDVGDNPIADAVVTLEFSETTFRLFSDAESGTTLDCAARRLSKLTDLYGVAVFHPRFGGSDPSGRIVVAWEGAEFRRVPGRSTDLDGIDGAAGLGDLTLFSASFASGLPAPTLNFDDSSSDVPDLADLSLFTQEFALAMHSNYCP